MDIFIKNGKVIDFKEDKLKVVNIGIEKGIIKYIGSDIIESEKVIDAKGKIVAPGFIDIHMHEEKYDGEYYISKYMLNMGVTTALAGNCGNNYSNVEEMAENIEKNGCPINYMALTGYTDLREKAGATDRYVKSTDAQIEEIIKLYRQDLKNGSKGISFGIEYAPGITKEEMIKVIDSADKKDILVAAHYRRDANHAVEAIEELIDISRTTDTPMQVSHIGSCSALGYMRESLATIKTAREEGLDVMADCYPYDAFSTRIGTSVFDEGCFENWNADYSDILLTEEPYKGKYCDEKLFKKVREEHPDMLVVAFVMNEEEVIEAYKEDFVMVASDGLYNKGQGHPRGAGSFPRVISKYIKTGELDFIETFKKMSLYPAKRLGLNKGSIEVGLDGDLVIFDLEKIEDRADFTNPTEKPDGIDYVIVNGKIALEKGNLIDGKLGKFIKRKA